MTTYSYLIIEDRDEDDELMFATAVAWTDEGSDGFTGCQPVSWYGTRDAAELALARLRDDARAKA